MTFERRVNLGKRSLWAGALLAVAGISWAFKYTQDISVDSSGLTRAFVPPETADKYRVREEIRLFDPEGTETPYLFEYWHHGIPEWTPIFPTQMRNQLMEDRTVLTFSPGDNVREINLGLGISRVKRVSFERAEGSAPSWTLLAKDVPVQLSASFDVGSPRPGARYRFIIDDSQSPPSSSPHVSVSPGDGTTSPPLENVPFKTTGDSPWGQRLEIRPPRRNMSVRRVGFYIEDLSNVDIGHIRHTVQSLATNKERPVQEHSTAIATVVCPEAGVQPHLAVHMGVGRDDSIAVVYIPSIDGTPVRVMEVKAEILPMSVLFDAKKTGPYQLRFGSDGPATDPVLLYGDAIRSLSRRRNEPGIRTARIGKVHTLKIFAESMDNHLWDPLPEPFDPAPFSRQLTVKAEWPGIQKAAVPADVFEFSSPEGTDWRLTRNGRELPFLIRSKSGSTLIEASFTPLKSSPDTSRWELTGPFQNVPWITLRFDVRGTFPAVRARLREPGVTGDGDLLLEMPWEFDQRGYDRLRREQESLAEFKKEDAWTVLRIGSNGKRVGGKRLILEVDSGSFSLPTPQVSAGSHQLIFKADPKDEILFHFGGDPAVPPVYPLREEASIPVTVAERTAHFVPGSLVARPSNAKGATDHGILSFFGQDPGSPEETNADAAPDSSSSDAENNAPPPHPDNSSPLLILAIGIVLILIVGAATLLRKT